MAPPYSKHPSSYRDPSGFLFYKDGVLYRNVNEAFRSDFDLFLRSGLYDSLRKNEMLIPHELIGENLTGLPHHYTTLKPEMIPLISYSYEWSFNMLKEAALVTLDAAGEALEHGMWLKDAPASNVQWHQGKMILIDSLSFEKYNEESPWIAYRQFCENFFAPLALMHYLKEPVQKLLLGWPNGIPVSFASKSLPLRSRFNLHSYLHLHLHGSVANKSKANETAARPFSKEKMKRLLKSLGDGIRDFSFDSPSGAWSGYYEEAGQRQGYLGSKKEIINAWTNSGSYRTVIDVGSNEGTFSELLAQSGHFVISADSDHFSINRLYAKTRQLGIKNILPLVIDIAQPSPALGVNNQEFASFFSRTKTDVVIALALLHHLAIGKNIPFEMIAATFKNLGRDLIVEFIPKDDEKIGVMLRQKKDIYDWYSQDNFLRAFASHYTIEASKKVAETNRVVFLMKGI
ncbi:MAG TPA: hypothetical protein VNR87_10080 [Flavisolibacter sp.]|nr:hypothetical protein [Flavisolibacter sp.]